MRPVFISYSRTDSDFVERLRTDLQDAGITVWIDQTGLKPGTRNWEQALRDALREAQAMVLVATPDSRQSNYVQGEIEIAEMYRCPVYPIWAAGDEWADSIPLALIKMQHIDARGEAYEAAIPQLVEALGHAPDVSERPAPRTMPDFEPRNPYKGLRAFREGDAGDFFGRETLINELVDALGARLDGDRLLAIIGPSGSGKSSVVMAGLLPRVQAGALPGSEAWLYLDPMVPGTHPIESLSVNLANALPEKSNAVIRQDLDDPEGRGLHLLGRQIVREPDQRLLLFVDQFEELFTQTVNEDARRQFIRLLTTAVTEPKGPVMVVLTLRADFYDRPIAYPVLVSLIEQHQLVPPMTLDDLRAVIEQPAGLPDVQVTFEEGLVGDLLFEVREQAGGLPLLQFTLDQLFQQRDNHMLTLAAYRDMGGLRGALARHAEATFENLPTDEHRRLARTLFLRLIEPGQTEQDTTRRRADMSELELSDEEQTRVLREAADAFVTARLLTTGETAGSATIEVSHEALIREWERLGTWLHYAREDLTIQRNVSEDAAAWVERGRKPDDDGLYRGTLLEDALAWAGRNNPSMHEQAFLESSQRQELRGMVQERRRRRLMWLAGAAVIAVIIVSLVAVVYIRSMENERLQQEVDAFEIRQELVETWAAGDVGFVPFGEGKSSQEILATATKIAALNNWDKENPVIDEAYKAQYGVEMVQVPAGCFSMGSVTGDSDERPVHKVCFDEPFWIDRYEATNALYAECVDAGSCTKPYDFGDVRNREHQPVVGVTWFQADEYCQWRKAQLPTEAQWEYTARGPNSSIYPWGNEWGEDEDIVIYIGNADEPADVGEEQRREGMSWVGAHDMSGNVWEWVADWYDADYYKEFEGEVAIEPEGPDEETGARVIRGGSFVDLGLDFLRAAGRYDYVPDGRYFFVGFRCARLK